MTDQKNTHRVIAVFNLPAGFEPASLHDVAAWLGSEVNDDDGRGPEYVSVYANVYALVEDVEDGVEECNCDLPIGDDDEASA